MDSTRRMLAVTWPQWRDRLIGLPRLAKRTLILGHDYVLLGFALWLALSARWNELYVPPDLGLLLLIATAPLLAVATFAWFGLYRLVTRYMGPHGTGRMLGPLALSVLLWVLLILLSGRTGIPRSVPLIYFVFGSAFMMMSRSAVTWLLRGDSLQPLRAQAERKAILIYGAGPTGVQLLEALQRSDGARVAGFIDDRATLRGQYVGGVKVYRAKKIPRLIERERVKEVILAMPEARRSVRQEILKQLQNFPLQVKILPSIEDLAAGRVTVSDLRPVEVDDLLGRDPVPPDAALLARSIRGKSVMVTGAGGSIGSELVRQIVRQAPSRLVLLDISEAALYEIDGEIADRLSSLPPETERPVVVGVLGSTLDRKLVTDTIVNNGVQTIYHAAAYKHVPLVENNPVAGLANNTFGTEVVATAARAAGVELFVLISTDKAVRPTNVMGASKRLAELVLQANSADPGCETVFTMVRFGNVLDSSGSVVRRFRRQIETGGPITVTHPAVTRYFMSIPEAAELVLQAGAMASGGEVFVLEMGEPVKIDALARAMVRLAGLEVKDADNPAGDIAIVYTGLRPGEKLYEELLIGDGTVATEHSRIMQRHEPRLDTEELRMHLETLRSAMDDGNAAAINAVLMRTVEGYAPKLEGTPEGSRAPIIVAAPSRMLH